LGVYSMLMIAAGLLCAYAVLTGIVTRRERDRIRNDVTPLPEAAAKSGAFSLIARHRYLSLIAAFSLVFTLVNTNGEYLLGKLIGDAAHKALHDENAIRNRIAEDYSEFFFGVNLLTFLLQTFVVSRLVQHGGLRIALLLFPLIAMVDAAALSVAPLLALVRIG